MSLRRKLEYAARLILLAPLTLFALVFFGVGALIEWIWERVRR